MWTKLLIFFMLLILSYSGVSQSDSIKLKRLFVVKTDVLFPVVNAIFTKWLMGSITGEVGFSKRSSFQFTFLVSELNTTYRKGNNFQLIPEYKFYLSNKLKHKGLFLGIYGKYASIHSKIVGKDVYEIQYLEYKNSSLGGGFITGYQFYIKKRLTLEVLLGVGIRKNYQTKIIQQVDLNYVDKKEFYPDGRMAINIGYRF